MKQKLLLLILGVLSALPSLARDFTYTYEGQTITYTVINEIAKTCTTKSGGEKPGGGVYYSGNDVSGNLILPEHPMDGNVEFTLTRIDWFSFYGCNDMTSIVIPNSVTDIYHGAFSACRGLTRAEFASFESLYKIHFGDSSANPLTNAHHLYINNEEVTEIVIPNSLTSIGAATFSGGSYLTSIEIPNSVTSIGSYAFDGCSGLTSVEIPNSVTSIGDWAFNGCTGLARAQFSDIESLCNISFGNSGANPLSNAHHLYINNEEVTEIVIPNSLTSIGAATFSGGSNLTSIVIPNSVTSIGNYAFNGCCRLFSVNIPSLVTSIGNDAFYGCSGLTSVDIPSSVTSIGDSAFKGCSGLTSVEIPNSVTSINFRSFEDCSSLISIVIPNSVTFIDASAFYNCHSLSSLVIPNSVTTIRWSAFEGCSSLKSVVIPNSVTSIGSGAFDGCSGLSSVEIPNSVTSIGDWAFRGCSGLTSVEIPNSVTSIGSHAFDRCSGLISVEFPNSVTSIGSGAFYGCSGLTSVEIPNSVTTIEDSAFRGCSGLTSVEIPNSVTSIGDYVFCGCSGLTSVEIPNSVTSIGRYAFSSCNSLTSVVIPNSVTSIENGVFNNCRNLKKCAYPNNISNPFPSYWEYSYYLSYPAEDVIIEDGCIWSLDKSILYFVPITYSEKFAIPNTVTSINEWAFSECSLLNSIEFPNSVTSIGENAFYGCSSINKVDFASLKSLCNIKFGNAASHPLFYHQGYLSINGEVVKEIEIPNSVSSIGDFVFFNCDALTKIVIPNSVSSIGNSVFYNCRLLTKIEIPNSVISIGRYAFKGCHRLASVKIPNSVTSISDGLFSECGLESIEIPNSVTSIGDYAFAGGILESVVIPNSVKSIGMYAFSKCIRLSSVEIPNSVTSIGYHPFYGCSGLSSVVLSNSDTLIDSMIFLECPNIASVTSKSKKAPLINEMCFESNVYETAILNIPEASIIEYCCNGWNNFKNIKIEGTECKVSAFNDGSLNYLYLPDSREAILIKGDYSSFCSISIPNRIFPGNEDDPTFYNVTAIGSEAFLDCANLTSIEFPNTITSIGSSAFRRSGLTSIKLPEILNSIGYSAFSRSSLRDVLIPVSVKTIDDFAFFGCNELTSVTIDENVLDLTIGEGAFQSLKSLESIIIPDGVTYLGQSAFSYCDNLKYAKIGEGIDTIYKWTFQDCTSLCKVDLGSNIKIIGAWAFGHNNRELKKIELPPHLVEIYYGAFSQTGIDAITIPKSVEKIDQSVFSECYNLNSVIFEDGENYIDLDENIFLDSNVESIYLGRNVSHGAFMNMNCLKEVSVGNTVTLVPDSAFTNCSNLHTLKLGSSIESIADYAFKECALSDVTIPPSVNIIGEEAFADNINLEKINIGHNIKTIGDKAFDGCKASVVNITAQTPPAASNNCFSNYNGKLYLQGQNCIDTYNDAYTCWDRFDSDVMIDAEELNIDGANIIVGNPGNTFQLKATLMPEDVTLPYIFWRSTNSKIATVDNNGLVTLLDDSDDNLTLADGDNDGTCKIIAESLYFNGPIAEVTVNKSSIAVPYISIIESKLDLKVGQSSKLTVTAENLGDKAVTWKSSKESVAVVNENGEVTVVGVGKAAITASCGDLSSECSLKCYPVPGDANWSGDITITDAVDISNYVVKKKVAPEDWNNDEWMSFYTVGANANESEDGNITFADASAAVRLALAQPVAASAQKRVSAANKVADGVADALVIRPFTETSDGGISATVKLDNSIEYVALQADVIVPDGMDIELKTGSRAAGTHSLETMKLDDNRFRLALFNIGNKAFVDNDEVLLEITADSNLLSAPGFTIQNVIASDADANEYMLGTRADVATGVDAADGKSIRIRKVSDSIHISNAIGKNVEIYTSEGQKVKSFVAEDALEVVNLSSGLYVVKAGDKTLKVIM